MRRDTFTVQGFLLECFLYEGCVHTSECPGWKKKLKILLARGGEGGGGGGIRMSWVETFQKIN